jgi:hypothetical protein
MTFWDYLQAQKGARQTLFITKSARADERQSPLKERVQKSWDK